MLITLTTTLAAIFSLIQISFIDFTYIIQDTAPIKRAVAKEELFAAGIIHKKEPEGSLCDCETYVSKNK